MRTFSLLMLSTALLSTLALPAVAQGVAVPANHSLRHVHTVAAVQPSPVAATPAVVTPAPALPMAPVVASPAKPIKPDATLATPASPTARAVTPGAAHVN